MFFLGTYQAQLYFVTFNFNLCNTGCTNDGVSMETYKRVSHFVD